MTYLVLSFVLASATPPPQPVTFSKCAYGPVQAEKLGRKLTLWGLQRFVFNNRTRRSVGEGVTYDASQRPVRHARWTCTLLGGQRYTCHIGKDTAYGTYQGTGWNWTHFQSTVTFAAGRSRRCVGSVGSHYANTCTFSDKNGKVVARLSTRAPFISAERCAALFTDARRVLRVTP